jgi:hypothetical protein
MPPVPASLLEHARDIHGEGKLPVEERVDLPKVDHQV